jgi:hypothetical protein
MTRALLATLDALGFMFAVASIAVGALLLLGACSSYAIAILLLESALQMRGVSRAG